MGPGAGDGMRVAPPGMKGWDGRGPRESAEHPLPSGFGSLVGVQGGVGGFMGSFACPALVGAVVGGFWLCCWQRSECCDSFYIWGGSVVSAST